MLSYIHIPFCDNRCNYCSFVSYTNRAEIKKNYLKTLCKEINFKLKGFNSKIDTLYIGGGTPSTVEGIFYKPIFDILKPYFSDDIEITFEANPNSATFNWLSDIKKLGANRISLGAQSFHDKKLKFLGRNHTKDDIFKAIENAKAVGFENISIDLIFSTIFDSEQFLYSEIEQFLALDISHLSLYSLTIEENTKFFDTPQVKKESDFDIQKIYDYLMLNGFKHYEISNFGKKISKHNLGYWEYKPYFGFGCGAVGFDGKNRYFNSPNLDEYIQNPLNSNIEVLSIDDIKFEKIFLGFRSIVGVDIELLNSKQLNHLIQENLVFIENGKVFNKNFLLSDEISLFSFG